MDFSNYLDSWYTYYELYSESTNGSIKTYKDQQTATNFTSDFTFDQLIIDQTIQRDIQSSIYEILSK